MPLYIDNRMHEKTKLFPLLKDIAELARLEFGDVSFSGNGEDNARILIGVERKTLPDFLHSFTSGRLAGHQIPGMLNSYNYVYLIVEGIWRPNPKSGTMQVKRGKAWADLRLGKRKYSYREFVCALNTLTIISNVHVVTTHSIRQTALYIRSLIHWWNSKKYNEHRAHLAFQNTPPITYNKPGLTRRLAKELPGIGWKRSAEVAKVFKTPRGLINSELSQWLGIPGIGKSIASKVMEEISQ